MFAVDDIDFIRKRVNNTLLRCNNGEPIIVSEVTAKGDKVFFRSLRIVDDKEINVNMEDVDFRPVPLGYVNFERKDASWLCRAPIRAWRQGLHEENMVNLKDKIMNIRRNLRSTIMGEYPSLEDASKSQVLKAFHKDFAVFKGMVQYKGSRFIGNYNAKTKQVTLEKRFQYLEDYLQEVRA